MSNSATTATAPSTPEDQRAASSRTWTFTSKVTGQPVTVTCMPGCDLDHAKDTNTPADPEDICCITWGESIELPLMGTMCDSGRAEEFRILRWQMGVHQFSTKIAERLPHIDVEAIDDHWIEALDPDALATVIGQLQKQVDSLRAAHAQLVATRAAYIAQTGAGA